MSTEPLDLTSLLAELPPGASPWPGLPAGTEIGHLHLQVANLALAEAFYHGLLGLEVTQRNYPGALFLAAGGYHHHIAVNTWAGVGAPPAPADAVGLISFALTLPDQGSWHALWDRVVAAGDATRQQSPDSLTLRHPDGNGVVIQTTAKPESIDTAELGGGK